MAEAILHGEALAKAKAPAAKPAFCRSDRRFDFGVEWFLQVKSTLEFDEIIGNSARKGYFWVPPNRTYYYTRCLTRNGRSSKNVVHSIKTVCSLTEFP